MNSFYDILAILSRLRQNRVYLFWVVWILFFSFLLRLGYHFLIDVGTSSLHTVANKFDGRLKQLFLDGELDLN